MEVQQPQRTIEACRPTLGFTSEGIFRQDMVTKGRNRDTAWFAMTDGDWTRLRAGYEVWLQSENFRS